MCSCCAGVVESQRQGAAGSPRQTQCDGRAHDGGVLWRRGDVDDMPSKVNVLIPLGDGLAEDGGSDSLVYVMACAEGLLD